MGFGTFTLEDDLNIMNSSSRLGEVAVFINVGPLLNLMGLTWFVACLP
jgi:hypothetical protein